MTSHHCVLERDRKDGRECLINFIMETVALSLLHIGEHLDRNVCSEPLSSKDDYCEEATLFSSKDEIHWAILLTSFRQAPVAKKKKNNSARRNTDDTQDKKSSTKDHLVYEKLINRTRVKHVLCFGILQF